MKWQVLLLIAISIILALAFFVFYMSRSTPLGITLKVEKVNYDQPMNFTVLFKRTPKNGFLLYGVWVQNQMLEKFEEPMNFQPGDRLTFAFNYTGPIPTVIEVILDRGNHKRGLAFVLIEGKEYDY